MNQNLLSSNNLIRACVTLWEILFCFIFIFCIVCERRARRTYVSVFNNLMLWWYQWRLLHQGRRVFHQAVTLIFWLLSNRECGAGTFVNFASLERDGKLPYSWWVFLWNKRLLSFAVRAPNFYYLWELSGFVWLSFHEMFDSGLSKIRSSRRVFVYVGFIQLRSTEHII